jgi:NTE family protein
MTMESAMDGTPASGSGKRALVLGGGGALGIVQAAYIEAAFELGFRPDLVVGTSVGALNGAWVALHPDRPGELLKIWLGLDRLSLVHLTPTKIASRLLHPLSVTTNDVVPKLLERHMKDARIENATLELGITATNLTRGEKHVFREGPLDRAILASTAIPGVFEPVTIDGDQFVDGCVSASVDMTTAMEMGATEILAIELTPQAPPSHPKTAAGVLKQSFSILSNATTRAVEVCLSNQMPVRVIRPDLSKNSPWRLDDSAGSIARNLRLARESLHGAIDDDGHVAPAGTCWVPQSPAEDEHSWGGPMRYFGVRPRKAS